MSEHFERAIERLLDDRSPRAELEHLDDEEQQMLRMAQLLRGSAESGMDPDFRERLLKRISAPVPCMSRGGRHFCLVSVLLRPESLEGWSIG